MTMSQILYLFFLCSSIFLNSNAQDPCPSHKCNGLEIKYPFWLMDGRTSEQFCGYSGFGLTCSNKTHDPVLNLRRDYFSVTNINYDKYTLNLVDIDVIDVECPRVRNNFSVETLPLYQTNSDLNLTFYFNCTSPLPPFPLAIPINCLSSTTTSNQSYVFETTIESKEFNNWYKYCDEKVDVAVKRTEITKDDNGGISEFGGALNEGFSLDWKRLVRCERCEESGGWCGFNNTAKEFRCFCKDNTIGTESCRGTHKNSGLMIGIAAGAVVGGSILLLVLVIIYCRRMKIKHSSNSKDLEATIRQYGLSIPKRFRYSTVKKIANSFKDQIGKGGYGNVYKGTLADGRIVAVKVLKVTKGNGEEFINEVASIGRTSHVNVVTLLGFCYEGERRALIYEFMPNGSLEKFIHGTAPLLEEQHLGWDKLFSIAIGIARGLEYLHRGCNTRILHFDIKPHNILLDKDFHPKISDFGLAKLYNTNESAVSSLLQPRGTIGYIAPEVGNRNFGQVSHKSDVYSYGMMILEMVGGRKNVNAGADHTSEIYYPRWLYKRIQFDDVLNLKNEISADENELARKMVNVGFWCIQIYPSQRPSISKVIEMLEGKTVASETPPNPYLCSLPSSPSNSHTKLVICPPSGTEPTSST